MRFDRKSQRADVYEQALVWDFFGLSTEGFFVEVGANDPKNLSQTWLLERVGWRGILVEPLPEKCELLRAERPNSTVCPVAVSSEEKTGQADFHVLGEFSSLERNLNDNRLVYGSTIRVNVVTLDSVLNDAKVGRVDFLSIDTEGTEYDVLRGFDAGRYKPSLIMVEDLAYTLRLHDLLRSMRYRLVRRTGFNNWYVPDDSPLKVPLIQRLKLFRKMNLGAPLRARKFEREKRALAAGRDKRNPG